MKACTIIEDKMCTEELETSYEQGNVYDSCCIYTKEEKVISELN